MELFTSIATEEEFAGIGGVMAGSAQAEKLKEHLAANPLDNAECLAWLYRLRGDKESSEKALAELPEDRRKNLELRLQFIDADLRLRDQILAEQKNREL